MTGEATAVDRNLDLAMQWFGAGCKAGEVVALPGIKLVTSGLQYGVFNSALFTQPVAHEVGDVDRLLGAAAKHYGERRLPWSLWWCEDAFEVGLRDRMEGLCERHRLRLLMDTPGMYAQRLLAPTRELPPLEVLKVDSSSTRGAFAHITSVAFQIPFAVCQEVYGGERTWVDGFNGFVGLHQGVPVATAATLSSGGVAGVYSVATLPQHRRHGFAEAIMRHALSDGAASVLQATDSGLALYQQMGYRTVTRFRVYISK